MMDVCFQCKRQLNKYEEVFYHTKHSFSAFIRYKLCQECNLKLLSPYKHCTVCGMRIVKSCGSKLFCSQNCYYKKRQECIKDLDPGCDEVEDLLNVALSVWDVPNIKEKKPEMEEVFNGMARNVGSGESKERLW